MRVTGEGVWGDPKDPKEARAVLQAAWSSSASTSSTRPIPTAPKSSELLIAEVLQALPKGPRHRDQGRPHAARPRRVGAGRPRALHPAVRGDEPAPPQARSASISGSCTASIAKTPMEETLGVAQENAGARARSGTSAFPKSPSMKSSKARKLVDRRQRAEPLQPRRPQARGRGRLLRAGKDRLHSVVSRWPPETSRNRAACLTQAAKKHGASVSQLALAWLLHRSKVQLPIPGTSSVRHLEENTAAASLVLTDAEWKEIEKAAK